MTRFLRNVAILLLGAILLVYLAGFALLATQQRRFLFYGSRYDAAAMFERTIYRPRIVEEPDGMHVKVWQVDAAAGRPTIVFFYGNAGTAYDFASIGRQLHALGYGIVLASYRGYDGNPGAPSEAGLMDDARAILSGMARERTILWGQSLGTGIAARMAAEGRAKALILQSPYTSVVDVASRRFPFFPVRLAMLDRFDTLSLAPRIKVPVLVMMGTEDETIPYDMGETVARAAHAAFVPIPGGTHELTEGQVLVPAAAWLARHDPR